MENDLENLDVTIGHSEDEVGIRFSKPVKTLVFSKMQAMKFAAAIMTAVTCDLDVDHSHAQPLGSETRN